ncbi:MAG: glycosyltransferase family 2 protein [Pirellulales bacterium]
MSVQGAANPAAPPDSSVSADRGVSAVVRNELRISVVVPVRNEGPFIARTLQALIDQDYPSQRVEILVVDGDSDDDTPAIVSQWSQLHPQIQLLRNPRRWSSSARNIGIRHAQGDVVLVVDGHCQLSDRRYLANLVAAFERWGVDAVGRPQPQDVKGASVLQRSIAAARESRLGHHPDSYIYSGTEQLVPAHSVAVAYRRSVFDRIGLFDERFDACEDVELNHRFDRSGLRCVLAPSITLKYHPRSTLRGLYYQLYRYGRGRARLMFKHPDTFSWKTFLPALFVLGLLMTPTVAWWPAPLARLCGALWLIYGATVAATSAVLAARHRSWGMLVRLPLVFFTIHLAAGSGLLRELLTQVWRPFGWRSADGSTG